MSAPTARPSTSPTEPAGGSLRPSRRDVLVGAGAGAAALLLDPLRAGAQPAAGGTTVFTHTTVVTVD
ncbi:MAG: hypothetical protein AB7N90_04525, partial [Vicinamibacterales bacterium]